MSGNDSNDEGKPRKSNMDALGRSLPVRARVHRETFNGVAIELKETEPGSNIWVLRLDGQVVGLHLSGNLQAVIEKAKRTVVSRQPPLPLADDPGGLTS